MKFEDILKTVGSNTMIKVTVMVYGMKFSTSHYTDYYWDAAEGFLERQVANMMVADGKLVISLEEEAR